MKYILYIFLIIVLFTISVLGLEFVNRRPGEKDIALEVNRKVITISDFNRRYAALPAFRNDPRSFIKTIVTKELLVQEAIKQGIDKEPIFRDSIQSFYEQQLIKLLTDRMLASASVTVDDEEISEYLEHSKNLYHITIFSFDTISDAAKGKFSDGEKRTLCFQDIAAPAREKILSLKPGQTTDPIPMEGRIVVIRHDLTASCPMPRQEAGRETVRRILEEEKKTQLMDQWIENLREEAEITVHIKETR